MINDFILKTMDFNAANVDLKDFSYGILMGMFERIVQDNKFDIEKYEVMKNAR